MMYSTDVAIVLANTLANPGVYVLSLNGLYDPDATGSGHQPRGFDQLLALYDHYVVLEAKARISFANNSAANPCIAFAAVRDNTTTATTTTNYMESGNTVFRSLSSDGASNSVANIDITVNPNRFLGRRDPMSDPELKGSLTSNPSEGAWLHVGAYSCDLYTTCAVSLQVVMEYTVRLIEPKQITAS